MLLSAPMHKKQWVIKPPDERCTQLARSLKVSPIVAQVLINRDITDSEQGNIFLRPKLNELIELTLLFDGTVVVWLIGGFTRDVEGRLRLRPQVSFSPPSLVSEGDVFHVQSPRRKAL